ncbi:MAG: hypothetical protein KF764_01320 [Labilithrix sp.]|nr:hypothetical protein [Labilithrix sp.]MBX3225086.1 hypothetical protein [Labilithrix sp.]
MIWDLWKKGFYAWEDATAKYVEGWTKSPLLLGPSGMMLGGAMKAKAAYDKAASSWVGNLGLATKRDQERALHVLNQIESRLIDLEERLAEMQKKDDTRT